MKRKAAVFLSCAMNLFAADAQEVSFSPFCATTSQQPQIPVESGEPLNRPQSSTMVLKSARFETGDSWDYRFTFAFNEYYATEEGIEVAILAKDLGYDSYYIDPAGSVLTFDLDYHPGFQLGFIVNTPYDKWLLGAEYLWFRSHSEVSATAAAGKFYRSAFFGNNSTFGTGLETLKASWKLGVDLIDLYIARPFYASMKWSVEPLFGLRTGWIRQYFHMTTTPADENYGHADQQAVLKSNSWSIGPRGGLQSNWLLGYGFNLFGDLSASLLYAHYSTISVRNANTDGDLTIGTHNGFSTMSPNIDAGLGVKWGSYFKGQTYYFDLSAAYNFSAFFSQNQTFALGSALEPNPGIAPGTLYLHGVSIATSFLF